MKLPRRLAVLVFLSLAVIETSPGGVPSKSRASDGAVANRQISINRVRMSVNDRGGLSNQVDWGARHVFQYGQDSALYPIVYDQGPWIIGKLGGVPAAGVAHWGTSYAPGPIINGRPALDIRPQDSSRYHPYRINSSLNSIDPDVSGWPADLGAPVTPDGQPRLLGDELIWSVFNDADTSEHPWGSLFQSFPHLPVEIQQSVYSTRGGNGDTSLLANTLFMEWTFINKGTAVIDSCYIALWTDIDFDDMEHNFPAVDTAAQVAYCWDGLATPLQGPPYAVGYILLYGPVVPDAQERAVFRGRTLPGYRNLPLSSFWGIIFDYSPLSFLNSPVSVGDAWNLARGCEISGSVIIDSVTKTPTRFPYSGDPITGKGWVYNLPYLKGEEGFMMFAGPFTFAPGDTQWMMTALVPAAGSNGFESIRLLRNAAYRLRAMSYGSIAHTSALIPAVLPQTPKLYQNYPNPFNPGTTIRYSLPFATNVLLTVHNVLGQKVRTLVQETQEIGLHEVSFDGRAIASGVYFYRMQAGSSVQTKKLILLH